MTRELPTTPISFLMPVCNEVCVIEEVIHEWQDVVFQYLPHPIEFIFDDCSTDGTQELLLKMSEKFPYIKVLKSKRDGFFNSAMRLYKASTHPVVFFTDSDGQYVPSEFWKLTPYLAENDIVHGAKTSRKDPFYRVTASSVFNVIVRMYFKTASRDVNSAFRLVKRPILEQILPKISHMPTLLNAEMLIRAEQEGFKVKSIPVMHRPRKYGESTGLPFKRFHRECLYAFRGLGALRNEYRK